MCLVGWTTWAVKRNHPEQAGFSITFLRANLATETPYRVTTQAYSALGAPSHCGSFGCNGRCYLDSGAGISHSGISDNGTASIDNLHRQIIQSQRIL